MKSWDHFWVEQSSLPPVSVLVLFCILHVIILLFVYFNYKLSRNRIIQSCRGPFPSESLQIPEKMLKSLKFSLVGLSLLLINNTISHLSGIIFYHKKAYFAAGSKSVLSVIGLMIFLISIIGLIETILKVPQSLISNLLRYTRLISFLTAIAIFVNIILISFGVNLIITSIISLTSVVAIFCLVAFELFFLYKIEIFKDKIIKLRYLLFILLIINCFVYLLISSLFIPQDPIKPGFTNKPTVELLIFVSDIMVVISNTVIYLIIYFPSNLRKIFNISEEEFLLYRDERMDFEWHESHWAQHENRLISGDSIQVDPPYISLDTDYIIIQDVFKNEKYSKELKEMLKANLTSSFQSNSIISFVGLNENYFQKQMIKISNLVFFISSDNLLQNDIFQIISTDWNFNISVDNKLVVNDFRYDFKNYAFSMIIIIPSPWNFSKKMWIIVCPEECFKVTTAFLTKFNGFLNQISIDDEVFLVLKLPIVNGEIMGISSQKENPSSPTPWNLIFLL